MGLYSDLSLERKEILGRIKAHSEKLLDRSFKFKYFTLHGKTHIENMINIANMLIASGIVLTDDEKYYLALSILVHDLGMVVPLSDNEAKELFSGVPQVSDPALIELYIRNAHHSRINEYIKNEFEFLTSLGLNPSQCGIIKEISANHRKTDLKIQMGLPKKIGALLRLIDELDIGPERAPIEVLKYLWQEMDSTSCWHWFKHNIVDNWSPGHNVNVLTINNEPEIDFEIVVRPPKKEGIPYWGHQIIRPINKVLEDECVGKIIYEYFKVKIKANRSPQKSMENSLGDLWERIENKAMSGGRKTILLIDDEVRKMEDLMYPLMMDYQVLFAPNAKDAMDILGATKIDLAIVDIQIGSGGMWEAKKTADFKNTGVLLCSEILKKYKNTKVGVLTGTQYNIDQLKEMNLEFIINKPVLPRVFERKIRNELR